MRSHALSGVDIGNGRGGVIREGCRARNVPRGGVTRLLFKVPGPSLWLQNLTITNGQAPNANGNATLDPNHWVGVIDAIDL